MDMPPNPPPPFPGVFSSSLSMWDKRSTSSARNPLSFVYTPLTSSGMEGSGLYGELHVVPSRDSLRLEFGVLSSDSKGLVRLRVFSIFEEGTREDANFGSDSSRLFESSWSCSCYSSEGAAIPTNRWTGTIS